MIKEYSSIYINIIDYAMTFMDHWNIEEQNVECDQWSVVTL